MYKRLRNGSSPPKEPCAGSPKNKLVGQTVLMINIKWIRCGDHNCICESCTSFKKTPGWRVWKLAALGQQRVDLCQIKDQNLDNICCNISIQIWPATFPQGQSSDIIPDICHFLHGQNFWRIKFTPKKRVNYDKIHSKLPIFCVKSVKIYTGQKKFTQIYSWRSWKISGMYLLQSEAFNHLLSC